jgi:ATP-binding protein involved in chromosome partitioning
MPVSKRDVISALNRARLSGCDKGALAMHLILDVLLGGPERDEVTVLVADRIGGPQGAPVPAEWLHALEAAVAAVPGVRRVRVEPRPAATPPPSLQQQAQRARPVVEVGAARVLAVASGKGGVGKSTVTANLAAALAAMGHRVGAVDADIYGFSLPALLGVTEPPRISQDKRWIPARAGEVRLLSMEFFVPPGQAVVWRGPMLGKALHEFLARAEWGELDFLLLDLPPGTGDVALDVHEMLPGSQEIVVTTPDPLAARVAIRAGQMAQKTGHTVLGVVENMSYLPCPHCGRDLHPFGEGGGDEVAAALGGVPVLARVPLGGSARPGTGLFDPDSGAGRAFRALAEAVAAGQPLPARGT